MTNSNDKSGELLGQERRRRWSPEQKLAMVRESLEPGQSVSVVARRNGINANQLFLWRKLYQDGSLSAVSAGEAVVPASELSDALKQIRELQRMLGKKTMEAEILKEAVEIARSRNSEWIQERDLAKRILNGDRQAKLDAIEAFEPFTEISLLGSAIQTTVHEHGIFESRLSIHGSDLIPTEIKSLLKSGKLSTKAIPIGRFNDLHQDYVCSCALRVGRELLAVLPDDLVIVTAMDNVLNGATGHMQELPILSVAFSRSTMDALNLDAIDPSDAMKNFVHNMSFKKTFGFEPVAVLDATRFAVGA